VLSITEAQELREARSSRILRRDTSYIQLTYLMQAKTLRIKKVATVEVVAGGGRHFNIDVEAVDTYRDSHDPCSDGLQVDPAKYTAELRHT